MNRFLLVGLILTVISFCSCSTETGVEPIDTNPVKATYSSISTLIFDKRCAKSGCHLDSPGLPMLKSNVAYNNIVSVKNNAGSLNYIEPGNPDNSYLFQKVLKNGNRSGLRMPQDGATTGYLSQVEIDSIRVWIEMGAQNN